MIIVSTHKKSQFVLQRRQERFTLILSYPRDFKYLPATSSYPRDFELNFRNIINAHACLCLVGHIGLQAGKMMSLRVLSAIGRRLYVRSVPVSVLFLPSKFIICTVQANKPLLARGFHLTHSVKYAAGMHARVEINKKLTSLS